MKLAAVNPRLDFNIEDFFAKEVIKHSLSKTNHALAIHEQRFSNFVVKTGSNSDSKYEKADRGSTCPSKFWAVRLAPTYLYVWAP